MEAELRGRTTAILDAAAERGECDFLVDVAAELPLQAIAQLHRRAPGRPPRPLPLGRRHARLRRPRARPAEREDPGRRRRTCRRTASARRREAPGCPADDILSAVVSAGIEGADGAGGPLSDLELQMFFNLLIAAGSETTRNSIAVGVARAHGAARPVAGARATTARSCRRRWRRSCAGPRRRPTTGAPRPRERRARRPGDRGRRQGHAVVGVGEPRRDRCSTSRSASTSAATRTRTSPSGTARTSASAPTSPASRSGSCSTRCSTASTRSADRSDRVDPQQQAHRRPPHAGPARPPLRRSYFVPPPSFRATAAFTSALNAWPSSFAPSWRSIARRVFPSRLELNSPVGSGSEAPRANVSLTLSL